MVKKNVNSTQNVTPVVQATPTPAPVSETKPKKQKAGAVPVPVPVAPAPAQVAPVPATGGKRTKKAVQTAGTVAPAPTPVVSTPVASPVASTPVAQTAGGKTRKPATKTPRTKKTAEAKPNKNNKKAVANPVQAEVPAEGEERGRFFKYLYNGTVSGRFSGSKPKQAANKALTSIVKSQSETGVDLTNKMLTFSIIECTRGSKKKQYNYQGIRRALDVPIKVTIKNKDVPIVYKFQNRTSKLKAQPVASASA